VGGLLSRLRIFYVLAAGKLQKGAAPTARLLKIDRISGF